jgi:acyl-CoA thioesterase-1
MRPVAALHKSLVCSAIGIAAALVPAAAIAAETILIMGDSLSAGYGIRQENSWPALLEQKLRAEGRDYTVANVSISGETTAGGRSRLTAALRKHRPKIVVIALGANDGLRGLPLDAMTQNLTVMANASTATGARVLLVGMRLPPNYGCLRHRLRGFFPVRRRKPANPSGSLPP